MQPVVSKETHAYIGNWAQVNAKGDTAITVPTGTYSVESKDTRFNPATDISGDQINVHYTGNLKDGIRWQVETGTVKVKAASSVAC